MTFLHASSIEVEIVADPFSVDVAAELSDVDAIIPRARSAQQLRAVQDHRRARLGRDHRAIHPQEHGQDALDGAAGGGGFRESAVADRVIHGTPRQVAEQIIALREEVGPFGGLVTSQHDWDGKEFEKRSMRLLAEEVMPIVRRAAVSLPKHQRV